MQELLTKIHEQAAGLTTANGGVISDYIPNHYNNHKVQDMLTKVSIIHAWAMLNKEIALCRAAAVFIKYASK